MVNVTLALEELRDQLADVVAGSLTKGFELVAGVVGARLAKSINGAMNVGGLGGGGDLAGLREQIKDNYSLLAPLESKRNNLPTCSASGVTITANSDFSTAPPFNIVTTGSATSNSVRAIIVEFTPKPRVAHWSRKHASVTLALADLLEVTQTALKVQMTQLIDPITPAIGAGDFPSFGGGSYASDKANASGYHSSAESLFWDADVLTNPSFHAAGGFDYGSFSSSDETDDSFDVYVNVAQENQKKKTRGRS